MEVIFMNDWNYRMMKDGNEYILYVLCGEAAMYEKKYILRKDDEINFLKDNKAWCDKKAGEIRETSWS